MRRGDWLTAVLGIAAVAAAVFIVGGAFREGQAIVAVLVALAIAPTILSRRTLDSRSPLALVLAIPLALTAIQLIPIPAGLLRSLDPTGYALRDDGAALLDTHPWQSISLDPTSSLRALAYFTILLGVAVLALRFAASERGRYRLIAVVTVVCGLTAAIVGVHELLGLTALYGVYEPEQASPAVLGPLLNGNHLGCLMAVGAVLAIGLVMERNQRGKLRVLWVVIAGACAAVSVSTYSRGAALALAGGCAVTFGTALAQRFGVTENGRRRRRRDFMRTSLPIGVLGVCGLVLVVFSSASGVGTQLSNTSLQEIKSPKSKFGAWKSSMTLIEESPWVGVGRGGFETSFTRVHPAAAFFSVSHVENEYVQAVVDWGLPGALLLGFAGAWLAVTAIKKWRDGPVVAGALGAMAVVGAQSVVDFGVELLGVAVPVTLVAATLAHVPLRETTRLRLLAARGLRVAHVAALVGAAALLLSDVTTSVGEDHDDLLAAGDQLTFEQVRAAAQRHPLDYLSFGLAAQLMVKDNEAGAVTLLNHALVLHPTHPGLHRMAGRMLHNNQHDTQAAIEYAAALRGTMLPRQILREILGSFYDPRDAANAIPTDYGNVDTIVRSLEQWQRPEVSTAWLSNVLEQRPKDVHACELLYSISVNTGDLYAAQMTGKRCVELAPSHQTRFALARVLYEREAYPEVIQQLSDLPKWPGRVNELIASWYLLCGSFEQLGKWDDAVHCLHQLDARGLVSPDRREEITARIERVEKGRKAEGLSGPKPPKPFVLRFR
jgi:O-antigen ligase